MSKNYLISKRKPEVGDKGFIIGNRFVPIQLNKEPIFHINFLESRNEIIGGIVPTSSGTITKVETGEQFNNCYLTYSTQGRDYLNFGTDLDFTVEIILSHFTQNHEYPVVLCNTSQWDGKTEGVFQFTFNNTVYNQSGTYGFMTVKAMSISTKSFSNHINDGLFHNWKLCRKKDKFMIIIDNSLECVNSSTFDFDFTKFNKLIVGAAPWGGNYRGIIQSIKIYNVSIY